MLCWAMLGYEFFGMIWRKILTYINIEILNKFSWGFLIQIANSHSDCKFSFRLQIQQIERNWEQNFLCDGISQLFFRTVWKNLIGGTLLQVIKRFNWSNFWFCVETFRQLWYWYKYLVPNELLKLVFLNRNLSKKIVLNSSNESNRYCTAWEPGFAWSFP